MAGQDPRRRADLAHFLRSRRQRLDPAALGFPSGGRRRISGLRREEVAALAGVSASWYTYLEQGRKVQPSPQVLDSLARALRLDEDERRYMHVLAAHGAESPAARTAGPVGAAVAQLVDTFGMGSYPIYAIDEIADIVAWNAAAAHWYTDFTELPDNRRNMLWWMLTTEQARERLVDWEADCRDIVGRYRTMAAQRHSPRVTRFVAEMEQASPEFARWWGEHHIRPQRNRVRIFRHPEHGLRAMRLQVLIPSESNAIRLVFHLPNEDT